MNSVFPVPASPMIRVDGTDHRYPVRRIYCVGRNYAAHAREMGHDPEREPPFFFGKPSDAVVNSGDDIPYPSRTSDLQHEVELVVALAAVPRVVTVDNALDCIYGYAVGCDLTRRDLQNAAKKQGRPWDTAKGFESSAVVSALRPVSVGGHVERGRLWLQVNGRIRQEGDIGQMIWSVAETITELSTLFELRVGDLIYTGTPAGVGALNRGDLMECGIDGLTPLINRIT